MLSLRTLYFLDEVIVLESKRVNTRIDAQGLAHGDAVALPYLGHAWQTIARVVNVVSRQVLIDTLLFEFILVVV